MSLLLAGVGEEGPQLFCTDPSGTYIGYDAHAIGNGSEGARNMLEERYDKGMSLEAAETLIAVVLRRTMEERITVDNVEIARVTEADGYHVCSAEELEGILERAAAQASAEEA